MNIHFKNELNVVNHLFDIRDYIINNFNIRDKKLIQFFNFLFILKLIEPLIKIGQFESIKDCLYSSLISVMNSRERYYLLSEFRRKIFSSSIKDSIFIDISFEDLDDKNDYLYNLLDKIDILDLQTLINFNISGRIYEILIFKPSNNIKLNKKNTDNISKYFTSRTLIRYIISKVDPIINEDKIKTMGDFFCGSGGFISEYVRYINHKNKNINWNEDINKLYGFDIDLEIIKMTRIDLLCLTNTLNDINIVKIMDNIKCINSTFSESNFDKFNVDYNFTNSPYEENKKYEKVINIGKEIMHIATYGSINNNTLPNKFKATKTKPYLINGDNKEMLSLMHGMGILKKDGVYCGILKENIFIGSKFKMLRKQLIENYNVTNIICIPQSEIWNTNTKSSILIFKNDGTKTKEILFCNIIEIIDDNNNLIGIKEVNSESSSIIKEFYTNNYEWVDKEEDYMKVTYEELLEKDYILNYKNYIKQVSNEDKGFKKVKLGELLKYKNKSKRKINDNNNNGIYTFYTSENIVKKCDFVDNNNELCIIFGSGNYLYIDTIFSCTDENIVCYTENIYITLYIFYYIKNKINISKIQQNILNELDISIPINIYSVKLYLDFLNQTNKSILNIKNLIIHKEEYICELLNFSILTKTLEDYYEYNFKDICKYQKKLIKYKSSQGLSTGKYNFYTSTIDKNLYLNEDPMFKEQMLIIKKEFSSVHYDINFSCEYENIEIIKCNIDTRYLYYYIKSNLNLYKDNKPKDILDKHKIIVLKTHVLEKNNLNEEFDFVDKLNDNFNKVLKTQEDITNDMLKFIELSSKTDDSVNLELLETNSNTDNHSNNSDFSD